MREVRRTKSYVRVDSEIAALDPEINDVESKSDLMVRHGE